MLDDDTVTLIMAKRHFLCQVCSGTMEHRGEHKVYLRLHGEVKDRFLEIKGLLGLENDTEVCRNIINDYWIRNRDKFQPKLRHFNLNEDGVLVLDPSVDNLIQVYFKPPDVVKCGYCNVNGCRHVEFALSMPEVQELLKRKGWKLKI